MFSLSTKLQQIIRTLFIAQQKFYKPAAGAGFLAPPPACTGAPGLSLAFGKRERYVIILRSST